MLKNAGRDKKRRWQEARITSKYLASSLNSCVYKPCMFARVSEVNPPPPPRPPAAGSSEVNPPPPPVAPAEGAREALWVPGSITMVAGSPKRWPWLEQLCKHSCTHGLHSCHVNTMHRLHSCAWVYSCHVNTCMYMGCIHVNTRPRRLESPCLEASC